MQTTALREHARRVRPLVLADLCRQLFVGAPVRVRPRARPRQILLQVRERPAALSVLLVGHTIEGVLVVAEVREAPLVDVQTLLLLLDARVDAPPPVEGAVVEEGEQLAEVLDQLAGLLLRLAHLSHVHRLDELLVALHLDHQRSEP